MPTCTTTSGTIFYAERGSDGPPLICIHGAGGSHLHWGYQLRDLGERARVLAIDLPGHGRSEPPGRATIGAYAEDVLALLDACALERAVLVGHSMGGAVALRLALDAPGRVLGLGLVGTGARLRVLPSILEGLAHDPQATLQQIVAMSYAPGAPAELVERGLESYGRCDPQVYRDDFAACDAFDVLGRLAEVRQPAAVVTGAEDRMTPPRYATALHERLPDATLLLAPDAGHMVMLEQPGAVSAALLALLERVG